MIEQECEDAVSAFDTSGTPGRRRGEPDGRGPACRELDVPLPAAALQFPLAHPAVVSCIAGADSAAQVRENTEWFEAAIPPELWRTLRMRGVIDERAPAPGDR